MQKIKSFSLFLCTSLLTACGGNSGGKSIEHTQTIHPQPTVKQNTIQHLITNENLQNNNLPSVTNQPEPLKSPVQTTRQSEHDDNNIRLTTPSVDTIQPNQIDNDETIIPAQNIPSSPATDSSDTAVFNRLSKTGDNFGAHSWLSIKLEGKSIALAPSLRTNASGQKIQTLRDDQGKLLGYIGYLVGTQSEADPLRPSELTITHKAFTLFGLDDHTQKLPTVTQQYAGEMYYYYTDTPVTVYTAGVNANYSAATKQVEMTISGRGNDRHRLWTLSTQADPHGNVAGNLIENRQPSGNFIGGFYGNEGKLLAGQAEFEDHRINQQSQSWKGVVGAIAN